MVQDHSDAMSTRRAIAGRFEIRNLEQDLLGRGSMGEVYRATDTHTWELVAVKARNLDATVDEVLAALAE